MNLREEKIQVLTTQRYYQSGQLNTNSTIWLGLHGYAQLARDFAQAFDFLNDDYLLFPEAPHKFYTRGISGGVGASWMTKEMREEAIQDYTAYIQLLYAQTIPHSFSGKINALGFSQGGLSLSRWATMFEPQLDNLIFWGSAPSEEILEDLDQYSAYFESINTHIVIGDQDELFHSKFPNTKNVIETIPNVQIHHYQGKHEFNSDLFKKFIIEKIVD